MKKFRSGILFLAFALSIFFYLNSLFQPFYVGWNNYDTTHGIYEEPNNTIEVLFLGSSYTASGIVPIELYEKYGICSYNLGTEQQPLIASYYWLKEVYERQSRALKTIVLDPQTLFHVPSEAFTQKALDGMRFSKNKIEAWVDFSNEWDNIFRTVPLVSYHRRWSSLTKMDFEKDHIIQRFNRGYWIQTSNLFQEYNLDELPVPGYYLDQSVQAQQVSEQGLKFLAKISDFCRSHSLNLVIAKTPTNKWTSSYHLALAQELEEEIFFLDFNFVPLIDEIHFTLALDTFDLGDPEHLHLNYYGATKYTDWIGNYLIQNNLATDIRGQEKYAFMEDQLREWHENVTIPEPQIDEEYLRLYDRRCENARIESYLNVTGGKSDLGTYLNAYWDKNSRVIMFSKCGDTTALDDESRKDLEALGLNELSGIGKANNYVGIVDEGAIFTEIKTSRYETASAEGINYLITSSYTPEATTIRINGKEYFGGTPGLSVVIYDKELNTVVSQAVFF